MREIDQERWLFEQNIARFEEKLKQVADQKEREMLKALIARERERHAGLPHSA